ncbi:hypothetical protein LSH36_963g00097 [Paralvinella palmiformis]|uniref:Uncharacterized protein n=1 Tax=Paralvinella palmiformis TaxID=53620 RepID=A0AAD9IXF3_9ANNE|nr:hypothetical protein LSH36_963g00097 [Paralvinella palmiformis]
MARTPATPKPPSPSLYHEDVSSNNETQATPSAVKAHDETANISPNVWQKQALHDSRSTAMFVVRINSGHRLNGSTKRSIHVKTEERKVFICYTLDHHIRL